MSEQGRAPWTERCPSGWLEHDSQPRYASRLSSSQEGRPLPRTDENKLAIATSKGVFADAVLPHDAVGLVQCWVDY
jgi:hypothetical protein